MNVLRAILNKAWSMKRNVQQGLKETFNGVEGTVYKFSAYGSRLTA